MGRGRWQFDLDSALFWTAVVLSVVLVVAFIIKRHG